MRWLRRIRPWPQCANGRNGSAALVCAELRAASLRLAIASIVLVLLATIACADPGDGQTAPSKAPEGWTARRLIRFGGDAWYEPFEWRDHDGMAQGFHVELMKEIGRVLNADIEVTLGPWDEVYAKLKSGEIDVVALAKHPHRESDVDFCTPHSTSASQVFARRGGLQITELSGLSGKRVLVEKAGLAAQVLPTKVPGVILQEVDSQVEALTRLAAGEGDGAIGEQITTRLVMARHGLSNLVSTGPVVLNTDYALGVRKGNTELRDELDRAMAVVKNTGVFDQLYHEHCAKVGETRAPLKGVLVWAAVIGGPLVILGVGVGIWNRTLRGQVKRATATLESELVERARAEAQTRLLLAELDHRVRNTLASIVGLVQQSPVTDTTTASRFREVLLERVQAMSAAYDAMRKAPPEGVQISSVLAMLTRALAPEVTGRIEIKGGGVRLSREDTPHVSLVLHELLSNAATWGALRSSASGSVAICAERGEDGTTAITWIERSPGITPATLKPGFGLSITRGLIEHQLRGVFEWHMVEGGVDCRVTLPGTPDARTGSSMTIEEAAHTPVQMTVRARVRSSSAVGV